MLEPFNQDVDDGIILEFKVHDPETEKTLADTVQTALQQIRDRKYGACNAGRGVLSVLYEV